MANKAMNDLVEDCRICIWNAADDEVIHNRFLPFGFTDEKMDSYKALYNETVAIIGENESEQAEWRAASALFKTKLAEARRELSGIKESLKFWYDSDSPEAVSMGLYTQKVSKYADFLHTGKHFYDVLLTMTAVLEILVPFGYSTEKITALRADLDELDVLKANREKERGDAQYTIQERNTKLDELNEVASELIRLGRLVFKGEESQHLEKLGVVV